MKAFTSHSRIFEKNTYVYPVISRRSKGVSIGININQDKLCNFNCIYCQVNRETSVPPSDVDPSQLRDELTQTLQLVQSGRLFELPAFAEVPAPLRRLNDIALSGDGEPTLSPHFNLTCQLCVDVKHQLQLDDLKIIVITNATRLLHPEVQQALTLLDQHNGEVWAKLDAGTEPHYQRVNQSGVPFDRIYNNILECAKQRPIVIQTLFFRYRQSPPSPAEIKAYAHRLVDISQNGQINYVQLHTVARSPRLADVTPLTRTELDAVAQQIQDIAPLHIEKYYSPLTD